MSSMQKELERAFKLIKRDKIDEALTILRPIVNTEPDNVHAWWLLAYAATEPDEVREALLRVLSLDPDYANAPRAREMLIKLNEEYPPDAGELMRFPELRDYMPEPLDDQSDIFGDSPFESLDTPFEEPELGEPLAAFPEDVFGAVEYPDIEEPPFSLEDPFAELGEEALPAFEEDAVSPRETERPRKPQTRIPGFDLDSEPVDDETLAAHEEHAAAHRGWGRRLVFSVLGLIGALAVVALILIMALPGGESKKVRDPGRLEIVEGQDEQLSVIQAEAFRTLQDSEISSFSQVVIAQSEFGETLFVEICSRPGPELPQLVQEGMTIAAQRASFITGQIEAVGVTVDICGTEHHDTLYRAAVTLENATQFAEGKISWDAFQSLWKTA